MRKIVFGKLILLTLLIAGCESMPKPRAASEYLYSTNQSTSVLLNQIKDTFTQHKYTVAKQDNAAGILLMAPRTFVFTSSTGKIQAHQMVQIRQEGGSLKIRMAYDCNYGGDQKAFVPCLENDAELAAKAGRMESAFIALLTPFLHAERQTASTKSLDDKTLDSK